MTMVANIRAENPAAMFEFIEHIRTSSETLQDRLLTALHYIGGELQSRMRTRASAQLQEQSGKLQRSIYYSVKVQKAGSAYVLTAGVARRAFYAAFQEKGIPIRLIDIKKGKRRYQRILFLRSRPFIGPSIDEMKDEIVRAVEDAYRGVWSGA